MNDHSPAMEREPSRRNSPDDTQSDVVSLKPLFRLLADYRRVLALTVAGAMALCMVVLVALLLILPAERTASIQVRMLFDGAADGRYPNGTTFSPAEIAATPVLSEVYRINDLQRFGPYEDFKESMTVLQSSVEQELLAAKYSARLADNKLTPTDRARLEDEYRKQQASIKDPAYTLSLRRSSRLHVIPAALSEKVLNDTLAVWAQQAKDLKGATRFNVPLISRDILDPKSLDTDFLVAADDLRLQARRAAAVARDLLDVPGSGALRTQKEKVSLSDVAYALSHVLRTEIEPLVFQIQQSGLAKDPAAMQRYVQGRVSELRLERDATRARMQTLREALEGYMSAKGSRPREGSPGAGAARQQGTDTQTLIPQLSDTFLDRIIEMSTQTQAADVAYRQDLAERLIRDGVALSQLDRDTAYYEQLEKAGRAGAAPLPAEQAVALKNRLQGVADSVQLAVGRLVTVYEELSEQQLNPATTLYLVSKPFAVRTRYALTWTTAALSMALAMLLALIAGPVACAYHRSSVRRGSRPIASATR